MSYTRTYHGSVTVSGSEYVSYPASEHGGSMTVHYTKTEPVNISITVDTESFDSSVSRTGTKVDLLTASMTALEAAQIAAIKDQADRVSGHMIDGFFHLINSNLSSQKTECGSELQARFALLMRLSQAMTEKYERMESDFTRQQRHYAKIFQNLDETMDKKLMDLDKEAFLLEKYGRKELIVEPYRSHTANSMEQLQSTGKTNDLLTQARLHKKISDILENIKPYVVKVTDYKSKVDHMLESDPLELPEQECVPTIICGQRSLTQQTTEYHCFVPEMAVADTVERAMNEFAYNASEPNWHRFDDEELSRVDQFFSAYVQNSAQSGDSSDSYNERVHREMMKLWQFHKNDMMNM